MIVLFLFVLFGILTAMPLALLMMASTARRRPVNTREVKRLNVNVEWDVYRQLYEENVVTELTKSTSYLEVDR